MAEKRLEKPWMRLRPSVIARMLRLSMLGVAVAGSGPMGARTLADAPQAADVPLIYHKGRNFRIPFNLNAEGRSRIQEVRLLVSEDSGYTWRPVSKTFPDHPTFTFRSPRDGEYWFAVQTLTVDGKLAPQLDATVEPSLKVIVDTLAPSLVLEPDGRRGSVASVRWEVKDEHLAVDSLVLEYQVEGVGVWRRVPVRRPRLIGSQTWDAGTAEALKVRMSVADRANNVTDAVIDLPEGTANLPEAASRQPDSPGPPMVEPISNATRPRIMAGPGFTPVGEDRAPGRPPSLSPSPGRTQASSRARTNGTSAGRPRPAAPDWDREPGTPAAAPPPAFASTPAMQPQPQPDLFATASGGAVVEGGSAAPPPSAGMLPGPGSVPAPSQPPSPAAAAGAGAGTLLVDSPRFKLQYAVDDAGPSGPAIVELWITQDGGRTWIRRAEDPDRISPIEVDLGGEGTYGICLVARSASGLGDQPPAPGDPPQTWVEVDATPPAIQLDPPQVGTGVNSGKVAIAWRATDLHLAARSVSLSWRPDQPGAAWQPLAEGQENTGRFIWTVPSTVPPRFHLRVEAADSVGHRGWAETTDGGPIIVDRSRPRSRIIGLDPNARAGLGPGAWPLR